MRIGIVCPYSFDVPGGVQFHVRDLAEHFIARATTSGCSRRPTTTPRCPLRHVVRARRSRCATTARWPGHLRAGDRGPGEPLARGRASSTSCTCTSRSPAASLLALWARPSPIVATFHPPCSARAPCRRPTRCCGRPGEDPRPHRRLRGRPAHRQRHIGGDAVVIPNGVYVDRFAAAPRADPSGAAPPTRPTIAFLGRIDEPRKGLPVLLAALPAVLARIPGARFLVAGPGDAAELAQGCRPARRGRDEFLGRVTDEDKATLLRSVDVYVAPHLGRRELRHRARRGDGAPARRWWPATWRRSRACSTGAGRRCCSRPGRPRPVARPARACSPTPSAARPLRAAGPGRARRLRLGRGRRPDHGRLRDRHRGRRRPSRPTPRRRACGAGSCAACPAAAADGTVDVLQLATSSSSSSSAWPGTCRTPPPGSTGCTPGRGACPRSTPRWCAAPRPPSSSPTAGCSTRPAPCSSPTPPPSRSSAPPSSR